MDVDTTSHPRSPDNAACDRSSPSTHNSTIDVENEIGDSESEDADQLENGDKPENGDQQEDGDQLEDEGTGDEDEGNGFDGEDEQEDDPSEGKPRYEVPDHISFIPDPDGSQLGLPCSSYGE